MATVFSSYYVLCVCCAAMYPSTSPACFQVKSLLRPATALPAVTKEPTAAGDCAACTSAGQPPSKHQKSVGMVKFSVADPGPGSRIRLFPFPDPNSLHPGSRIRIKEFKYFIYFYPKKWFLSSKKYDPGCDPDADFLPIPDPGGQKGT
jgi:hypothetical protein